MRFLAFCLGVSALAVTSVAVLSALQNHAASQPQLPREPSPEPPPGRRTVYPLGFSTN
jgi:hypothetical protein